MPDTPQTLEPASEARQDARTAAHEGPRRFVPREARWTAWALAAAGVLLALCSGLMGGLLALRLQPTTPPLRIAVVDTTKIAEALAEAAQHDTGVLQRFPRHFDEVIRQLQDTDPYRVFLVREAVIGTAGEDVTPLILQDLHEQATPAPAAPSLAPTTPKGAPRRTHGP